MRSSNRIVKVEATVMNVKFKLLGLMTMSITHAKPHIHADRHLPAVSYTINQQS